MAVICLGWLAVFGVLTLLELRRLSARIDDAELDAIRRETVIAEDAAAAVIGAERLRREIAELRGWRAPSVRFDHEPAVDRLLDGESDASARRGQS